MSKRNPESVNPSVDDDSVNEIDALQERKAKRILFIFVALSSVVLLGAAGVALWFSMNPAGDVSLEGSYKDANVLLVTLDTVRADCLGCYGHPTVKTPVLDGLSKRGVQFLQCSATAPITLPSHVSILTSTYPYVHGARNNGRFVADAPNVMLSERLKKLGYTTGAEVAAYVLHSVWGLNQGFDTYRSERAGTVRNEQYARERGLESEPAEAVCDRAIEWLDQHGKEKFFLWTHFFDPHLPWVAPDKFQKIYKDFQHGGYLAEISYVDEQLGRLLNKLDELGVSENTIVVVTADHGESIGAHREPTHGYYVYDTTIHVPLIVCFPNNKHRGLMVGGQVSIVDIGTTILSLIGAEVPEDVQGQSLVPMLEGKAGDLGIYAYGETVMPHDMYGYSRLRFLRGGGWKYIHAPIPELYEYRKDSNELVNVADRYPEQMALFHDKLESLILETMPNSGGSEAVHLSAEATRRLGALGYVGRYAPPTDISESELLYVFDGPDPKEKIEIHNEYINVRMLQNNKRYAEAETSLRALIAAYPDSASLYDQMALLMEETDRLEEAAGAYEGLLNLVPDDALAHFRYGKVLGQLKQFKKSISHLKKAVELMPQYADAHVYYGLALIRQGNHQSGIKSFNKALELNPVSERAYMGLSESLFAEKRFEELITVLQKGVKAIPGSIQLKNNLAWHLSTLPDSRYRDGKAAVKLAEEMLMQARGGSRPDLMDTLGTAYAESGDFAQAIKTTAEAVALADKMRADDLAKELRQRLALFEAGLAYHAD